MYVSVIYNFGRCFLEKKKNRLEMDKKDAERNERPQWICRERITLGVSHRYTDPFVPVNGRLGGKGEVGKRGRGGGGWRGTEQRRRTTNRVVKLF